MFANSYKPGFPFHDDFRNHGRLCLSRKLFFLAFLVAVQACTGFELRSRTCLLSGKRGHGHSFAGCTGMIVFGV